MSWPSWNEIAQLILAAGTFIAAISAALSARHAARGVHSVHLATNSMKDDLVRVTRISALAEGVLRGRQEVRAEQATEEETYGGQ